MGFDLKKGALAAGSAAIILAASLAIPFEGEKFEAYSDTGGIWTICKGHTGGVKKGDKATPEQCAAFLRADLAVAESAYDRLVTHPHEPNVKAAAIDFIFNVGTGNFAGSSLRKYLNAGNVRAACEQFPRWRFVAGKDCAVRPNNCYGIVKRREAERSLCRDPNYYNRYFIGPDNVLRGVRTASAGN